MQYVDITTFKWNMQITPHCLYRLFKYAPFVLHMLPWMLTL